MRRCLLVLILLIWAIPGFGQLSSDNPKVQRANEIVRRVGAAYGYAERKQSVPLLVMYSRQSSKRIAYLDVEPVSGADNKVANPYRNRLLLDERLFDVCEQVDGGSGAALAFVMAHELAHLRLNHKTQLSFAEVNKKSLTGPEAKRQQASEQEAAADKTGLLYAYMAGFDLQPLLATLFDSLYRAYTLSDNLPGYPSKTERKNQTRLQAETLRPVALLFWVGQTLYCRGYIAEAAQCYRKILNWNPSRKQQYPLREVFNNLGVCLLRQALAASPTHPLRYFALPFEIDPQNRLLLLDRRGDKKTSPLVDEWLRQADEAFAEAITLDRTYTTAHLNRATGALLKQNYYKANGYLQDVREYMPKSTLPVAWWTICSLANYGLEQTDQARRAMGIAKVKSTSKAKNKVGQQNAQLTAYNWHTLTSLLQKPGIPPQLPRMALTGCQSLSTPLIDATSPRGADFSQLLVRETKPDTFLTIRLATVQQQPFIEVTLGGRMFVLTTSRVTSR